MSELGIPDSVNLREIADSCAIVVGSYRKLTHDEIFEIFNECR